MFLQNIKDTFNIIFKVENYYHIHFVTKKDKYGSYLTSVRRLKDAIKLCNKTTKDDIEIGDNFTNDDDIKHVQYYLSVTSTKSSGDILYRTQVFQSKN